MANDLDQARYSKHLISCLLEGQYEVHLNLPEILRCEEHGADAWETGQWPGGRKEYECPSGHRFSRPPWLTVQDESTESLTWLRMRSRIEQSGQVESESWATVLDLERAIDALNNPRDARLRTQAIRAAAAVSLVRDGYEVDELTGILKGSNASLSRLFRQGKAFLLAFLRGRDIESCWDTFRDTR